MQHPQRHRAPRAAPAHRQVAPRRLTRSYVQTHDDDDGPLVQSVISEPHAPAINLESTLMDSYENVESDPPPTSPLCTSPIDVTRSFLPDYVTDPSLSNTQQLQLLLQTTSHAFQARKLAELVSLPWLISSSRGKPTPRYSSFNSLFFHPRQMVCSGSCFH